MPHNRQGADVRTERTFGPRPPGEDPKPLVPEDQRFDALKGGEDSGPGDLTIQWPEMPVDEAHYLKLELARYQARCILLESRLEKIRHIAEGGNDI